MFGCLLSCWGGIPLCSNSSSSSKPIIAPRERSRCRDLTIPTVSVPSHGCWAESSKREWKTEMFGCWIAFVSPGSVGLGLMCVSCTFTSREIPINQGPSSRLLEKHMTSFPPLLCTTISSLGVVLKASVASAVCTPHVVFVTCTHTSHNSTP